MNPQDPRLDWIRQYMEGTATVETTSRLEEALAQDAELRAFFLEYLYMDSGLSALQAHRISGEPVLPEKASPRRMVRWLIPVALAAGLLIFPGLASWLFSPRSPEPSTVIATIKSTRMGLWMDAKPVEPGTSLGTGVWEWQSGLVELETQDHTTLTVEAPARLEIKSPLLARLLTGRMVVRMEKGKSGFVVEMPRLRVTDLGTEFGVGVTPGGESLLQVFEGKVRAETAGQTTAKEIEAGESVTANAQGNLAPAGFKEDRFIRRFPARGSSPAGEGGILYSKSTLDAVRVAPVRSPVTVDGDLAEWNRAGRFRAACLPPFADTYFLEGAMMYDRESLYLAAHVGDPLPMRNTSRDGMEFAGGSVIVRLSTDRTLGWPLKGSGYGRITAGDMDAPATRSNRVVHLILWHDAASKEARLRLQYGLKIHGDTTDANGWQGAFRKDADGKGYTLEYTIPWSLLNCADDPPRAGDTMAALWMAHWSDEEGRVSLGQLVEITNQDALPFKSIHPSNYFQHGPAWGRAVYLPGD